MISVGARSVAQKVKPLSAVPASHKSAGRSPGCFTSNPVPTEILGRRKGKGPDPWAPVLAWNTEKKLMALGFYLSQLCPLWPLAEPTNRQKILALFSLTLPLK